MNDQQAYEALAVNSQQSALDEYNPIGAAFDAAAALGAFAEYRRRKSANTQRAQAADLIEFGRFLEQQYAREKNPPAVDWATMHVNPDAWRRVTWGLVRAFINQQLSAGFAMRTINRRLSTIKKYAGLAAQAGALSDRQFALIRTVTGYSRSEGINTDNERAAEGIAVRRGAKKATNVLIDDETAKRLKEQPGIPETPQARRDRLLMCLLLDHGLRCGEIAGLMVECVLLNEGGTKGTLKFYRPKVKKTQTIELSKDTVRAYKDCADAGELPPMGPLLRASRKGAAGELTHAGMSARAITKRVRALGQAAGLEGLSPHDCRHYWATYWAARVHKLPKNILTLQEAGGWNSLAMPRHYVAEATIANEGMV